MPIDPFAALNAMLRAEAARFTPPPRPAREPSAPEIPVQEALSARPAEPGAAAVRDTPSAAPRPRTDAARTDAGGTDAGGEDPGQA
ncbi:hypothetical protein AB0953_01870 [Streptomyces sp. NPDC046866]|uniref:hypothetical protein n=1 Tax=Streptomyces sp. NPDC046866 TaxID=3154921 RepID=UPI0034544E5E